MTTSFSIFVGLSQKLTFNSYPYHDKNLHFHYISVHHVCQVTERKRKVKFSNVNMHVLYIIYCTYTQNCVILINSHYMSAHFRETKLEHCDNRRRTESAYFYIKLSIIFFFPFYVIFFFFFISTHIDIHRYMCDM